MPSEAPRFSWVLLVTLAAAACTAHDAAPPPPKAPRYLLVWAGDQAMDDGKVDPDFLAVIDASKGSPTYGKVLATGALPCVTGAHLFAQAGFLPADTPSCKLNEAHHMSMDLWVDPATKHQHFFTAGIFSSNIFRFDVTDPLQIPTAELAVSAAQLKKLSAPDELMMMPNGHVVSTGMGAKDLTTPGGLIEFDPKGAEAFLAEHIGAKPGGPARYLPNADGVSDTGLLAQPHGFDVRSDLDLLVSSDFSEPLTFVTSPGTPSQSYERVIHKNGTTIRTWKLSDLAAGPTKVIQMPKGPRKERRPIMNEPEAVMDVKLFHQPGHKGALVFTMAGSTVFYTPDITVAEPKFTEVWDFGPRRAGGLMRITQDDHFALFSVTGIKKRNPDYERDFPGEDAARIAVLDLSPLHAAGNQPLQCGPPKVYYDAEGFTSRFDPYNNHAVDCPTLASQAVVDTSLDADPQDGGPHHLSLSPDETQVAFSNYFMDVRPFSFLNADYLPRGDLHIYVADFDKVTGQISIDTGFRDELTGLVGVDFHRPLTYQWPSGRGATGNAKPHAGIFLDGSLPPTMAMP